MAKTQQELERDIFALEMKLKNLEDKVSKLENEIERRLKSIEDKYDKLSEKIQKGLEDIDKRFDKLEDDSQYAKGFIKAVLIFAGIVAFGTSIVFNLMKT